MEGGREERKKEGMKEGINIIVAFYKAERLPNSELVSTHTVKFQCKQVQKQQCKFQTVCYTPISLPLFYLPNDLFSCALRVNNSKKKQSASGINKDSYKNLGLEGISFQITSFYIYKVSAGNRMVRAGIFSRDYVVREAPEASMTV